MSTVLLEHIRLLVNISDEDAEKIVAGFLPIAVRKKEILQQEGQICRHYYFVEKGSLRLYFLDDKGAEQTIQFAIENWWLTDLHAFRKTSQSAFSIQAIEHTEVLRIDKNGLDSLLEEVPTLHRYFSNMYERSYAATLFRIRLLRLPRQEIYNLFKNSYPGIMQRIPQKLVASFLAITPEYLSELRRRQMKDESGK